MPSWNIHTAHVERLLAQEDPAALGIDDTNAFLMGNLVPDIYVGYMVPDVSHKIAYRDTHFAEPSFVPEPRYDLFWDRYARPSQDACGRVSDVVLGAWTHLLADHIYNKHFNRLLKERGLKPGEQVRISKQSDFDTFGRTLDISMVPKATLSLVAQCASFPQYPIARADVLATCAAMERIVRDNAVHHVSAPHYSLLGAAFFETVPNEVDALMREALHEYASGNPEWGRLRR